MTGKDYYDVKIVNDIIYNEQTNIVSVFKDYLIFDDVSESLFDVRCCHRAGDWFKQRLWGNRTQQIGQG